LCIAQLQGKNRYAVFNVGKPVGIYMYSLCGSVA